MKTPPDLDALTLPQLIAWAERYALSPQRRQLIRDMEDDVTRDAPPPRRKKRRIGPSAAKLLLEALRAVLAAERLVKRSWRKESLPRGAAVLAGALACVVEEARAAWGVDREGLPDFVGPPRPAELSNLDSCPPPAAVPVKARRVPGVKRPRGFRPDPAGLPTIFDVAA